MGTTTPNIGIYIPAAGETNYDQSFAAGMVNVDQHDHSGGPNKGLPIATEGLADFSVTFNKLSANVVNPTTGIGVSGTLPNQLVMLDLLKNIFQLAATSGFITKDGILAHARTFQNSASISWNNPAGVAGDPVASLIAPVTVPNGGTAKTSYAVPYAPVLAGTTGTGALQQPASAGNVGDVYVSQGASAVGTFAPLGTLGQIQETTGSFTAAQFNNLLATPVEIVPAPGAGKILVPISIYLKLNSDGTEFTTSFPNAALSLAYDGVTSATVLFSPNVIVGPTGIGGATTDVYCWATQGSSGGTGSDPSLVQDKGLFIRNSGGSEYAGGGSSTFDYLIRYMTITF
jgi:hypothetical protein